MRKDMFVKCWIILCCVIAIMGEEDDGPSLVDDLLSPYKHWQESSEHERHARAITNSGYNNTYEIFDANVTEQLLPTTTTKYFVSDVPRSEYYTYNSIKAYGHMTIITNPLRTFSVLEPRSEEGCSKNTRETVENTAKQRKCLVAQNGGFFNTKTGSCLGNIVSDGRIVQNHGDVQNANFGITKNGSIVVGYVSSDDIMQLGFKQLVGGAIWLVRNGKSYVEDALKCESSDIEETGTLRTFVDVQSARTAIGHDSLGRIILVNVEGQTRSRGLNLNQFARLLIKEFHLVNAINLDGGGSATLVLNGTLSNYPSDHCKSDPEWRCARAVSTIVCAHSPDCDPACKHGDCEIGRCSCHANYRGEICDELYCGYHNCSTHGACSKDGCQCLPGWHGTDCTVPCRPGYFGVNCSQLCRCKNNGTCNTVTGECNCSPGFGGSTCERGCGVGTYGPNCAFRCHCSDTCYCDSHTGVCTTNTTTMQDSINDVAQCLVKKKLKSTKKVKEEKSFLEFHWMAILSTTAATLIISVIFNIYMLLLKSDCTGDHYYHDDECCIMGDSDHHSNKHEKRPRYIPLHNLPVTERDESYAIENISGNSGSDTKIISQNGKTKPFSMNDYKSRKKTKSKLPSLKNLVSSFKERQRTRDGYTQLVLPDSNIEVEETSLLSQMR